LAILSASFKQDFKIAAGVKVFNVEHATDYPQRAICGKLTLV